MGRKNKLFASVYGVERLQGCCFPLGCLVVDLFPVAELKTRGCCIFIFMFFARCLLVDFTLIFSVALTQNFDIEDLGPTSRQAVDYKTVIWIVKLLRSYSTIHCYSKRKVKEATCQISQGSHYLCRGVS